MYKIIVGGQLMDYSNNVLEILKKLPHHEDYTFNVRIRELILKIKSDNIEEIFCKILSMNINELIKFNAYYALITYYRRYMYHSKLRSLVEKWGVKFKIFSLQNIVWSIYYEIMAKEINISFYKNCIKYAEKALKKLPNNVAVKHHYACMVGSAIDENYYIEDSIIDNALICLENAMEVFHEYPKHYCTKAILLLHKKDYGNALNCIHKAIDLEPKYNPDSQVRLLQYYYHLVNIKSNQAIAQLDKKTSEIVKKVESTKHNYLEMLMLFSAVLTFIFSTISISAKTSDFNSASGLLFVCASSVILVFGSSSCFWGGVSKKKVCFNIVITILLAFSCGIIGFLMGNGIILEKLDSLM